MAFRSHTLEETLDYFFTSEHSYVLSNVGHSAAWLSLAGEEQAGHPGRTRTFLLSGAFSAGRTFLLMTTATSANRGKSVRCSRIERTNS